MVAAVECLGGAGEGKAREGAPAALMLLILVKFSARGRRRECERAELQNEARAGRGRDRAQIPFAICRHRAFAAPDSPPGLGHVVSDSPRSHSFRTSSARPSGC